jgi:type I restriction enzyme S subunit
VNIAEPTHDPISHLAREHGDLVFARTGATTGKSYLIRDCPSAVFASYLIRVRAAQEVEPALLHAYFQTPTYWRHIEGKLSGNAQPGCNASKLAELIVPIPPVAEQRRIVDKVEVLLAQVNAAAQRLTRLARLLGGADAPSIGTARITQAILAKAFHGELVPTEAELARAQGRDYEPASVLLERIQAEREANGSSGNKRGRKARASKSRRQRHSKDLDDHAE